MLNNQSNKVKNILDIFVCMSWGILLLKYSLTRQLILLIHPNYFWLVTITGIILLSISIYKIHETLTEASLNNINNINNINKNEEHITLLPSKFSSILLIIIAISALLIPPKILASDTALQRGISDSLPTTRIEPQSWNLKIKPEERSLIEWIRTLNAYPEPDTYTGQKAKVTGFVVYSDHLPDNYFLISRFIITCCAVDAYPVGIPVKINNNNRDNYPPDTWLEIEGKMITDSLNTLNNNSSNKKKRQLVLEATSLQKISTPNDPYEY